MSRDARASGWAAGAALVALLALLVARIFGPGDLFDQTQPRTIAYTADMLARGGWSWLLPRDASGLAATKPPLYNWLAAPAVALLGRSSALAHKAPSVLALLGTFALLVAIGRRFHGACGWLAALLLVASHPAFKLGYLARPDMLLVGLLVGGWWAATSILIDEGGDAGSRAQARRRRRAVFWGAFVLAALTKGPVAGLLPAYALVGSKVIGGRWREVARFGLLAWMPLSIVTASLWMAAVLVIDRQHAIDRLWYQEFFGRVSGLGPEGGGRGPLQIVRGALDFPAYFVQRFAPWSLPALASMAMLFVRRGGGVQGGTRVWRALGVEGRWLLGAALWCGMVVAICSLSAGKRADYIAPAYPVAALLAAWLLTRGPLAAAVRWPWLVPGAAAIVMTVLAARNQAGRVLSRQSLLAIDEIVAAARGLIPPGRPVVVLNSATLEHLPPLLATTAPADSTAETARRLLERRVRFFAVAGFDLPHLRDERCLVEALADGRAEEIWSIELGEDAVTRWCPRRVVILDVRP